jgi:hypothetical protein
VSDRLLPTNALLQAVRVLHTRGAHALTAFPYLSPSGYWRCELYVGDDNVGQYSSADGWKIAGTEEHNADPESIALALWGRLSDDQRERALVPNVAYAFWFSAMLDACGAGRAPWLFSDSIQCWDDGYIAISGDGNELDAFPLPPGDVLPARTSRPVRPALIYNPARGEPTLTDAELVDPELVHPEPRGSYLLLEAVRVLHRRGASSLLAYPYFGRVGFWRCEFYVAGELADARYTEGSPLLFPGYEDAAMRDPESVADGIWSQLTDDEHANALVPNPAYTFWYSALLDRCGRTRVPVLYEEEGSFVQRGFIRIQSGPNREDFPLQPGSLMG